MIRAYHFVGDTLRDGRTVPADGEWLVHDGYAVMCESGLHASIRPSDALKYSPGNVLCLVECDDIVDEANDKIVCRRRRIVARFDATDLLQKYARKCALSVIHLWGAPAVVQKYLETGDESIRAAAREAARAAAREAAWAAARDAAWAAREAARDAARDAAWAAAWAAREAAWAAAWDAAGDPAWGAARDAAWAAAWDAYQFNFDEMVEAEFARRMT
jgi:hypothetical protein